MSGVILGNPTKPSEQKSLIVNFLPNLLKKVSERKIRGNALMRAALQNGLEDAGFEMSQELSLGFNKYTLDVFLREQLLTNLNTIDSAVLGKVNAAIASGLPPGGVTVNLGVVPLISNRAKYVLHIGSDPDRAGYLRFDFYNENFGVFEASYVVRFVNGNPVHGMLTYANSAHLSRLVRNEGPDKRQRARFLELAFEISNDKNTAVSISQVRSLGLAFEVASDFRTICDAEGFCDGQALFISSVTRKISPESVVYSTTDKREHCMALIEYDAATYSLSESVLFEFLENGTSRVEIGACELTPVFSGKGFTAEDLPLRTTETTPPGGTALEVFGDGSTPEGFHKRAFPGWDEILRN